MTRQLIFKEKYVSKLKTNIDIEFYKSSEFVYDKKQVLMLPNIEVIPGLASRLQPDNDCESAVTIFEALKNLEPIQASDERLWTYLSHVDLYPYMHERWNAVGNGTAKDGKEYILKHWFLGSSAQNSLLRHAIAGLWWAVYLSVDKTRGDDRQYDLTKILFRQLDFPTRTLGTYKLGRHKEAVIGILEFIEENDDLFKSGFESKTRFITKHLNVIGGVKPLAYYDRNFFKGELEKVKETIRSI
jgi:hypothetical protein